MINAATSYRRDDHSTMRVPVVMPLVEVTVTEEGTIAARLDGEPCATDDVLHRAQLKSFLDGIATEMGMPLRVEVRESDGSTFTDIVPPAEPSALGQPSPPSLSMGEVLGHGFLPNEDVAVAVVVAHQSANGDGCARLRLPPALLESHPGLVVLMGRKSGTVVLNGSGA